MQQRRWISAQKGKLVAVALVGAMFTLPGVAGQDKPAGPTGPQPLVLDVTGYEDRTTLVDPRHAPAPEAGEGIGPGSMLLIRIESSTHLCTANFIWSSGSTLYLGTAGHCLLPEDEVATHGPGADADASGTTVRACVSKCNFGGESGFFLHGEMVELGAVVYARQEYDGWGVGSDFGLVEIPSGLGALLRPGVPMWAGPDGTGTVRLGMPVCLHGNGIVYGETFATKGRPGLGLGSREESGYWYARVPALFGDSGGPLVECRPDSGGVHGRAALGLLTHGSPWWEYGTTLNRAIQMAEEANLAIQLVTA